MLPTADPPAAVSPLTARQREILAFIEQAVAANGEPPTVRALMQGLGLRSPNAVTCHVRALRKKGVLRSTSIHLVPTSPEPYRRHAELLQRGGLAAPESARRAPR